MHLKFRLLTSFNKRKPVFKFKQIHVQCVACDLLELIYRVNPVQIALLIPKLLNSSMFSFLFVQLV